jgi:sensor histidine kinase YesM
MRKYPSGTPAEETPEPMKRNKAKPLQTLGYSVLAGLVFGLVLGWLYDALLLCLLMALGIALTIWTFHSLLEFYFLPGIRTLSRKKRILIETVAFFLSSLLGFLLPVFLFSRIFRFTVFGEKVFWINLGLLIVLFLMSQGLALAHRFYKELRDKELAESRLKVLAAEAELRALKSQINPHFLFNTLNSINSLIPRNPSLAQKMIANLSGLLRMALDDQEKMLVPLRKELEFAHLYLELEKVRFGGKLRYGESVAPEVMDASFPAMILQPLLENAVKYGVALSREGGDILLELKEADGSIACRIWNTAGGREGHGDRREGPGGTGLQNIRQRLELLYGDRFLFQAGLSEESGYEIQMTFPLERGRRL